MPHEDDEYEYEYEEIEIEEEIEVDEEIDDDDERSMELEEEEEGEGEEEKEKKKEDQGTAPANSPIHRPIRNAELYGCRQSIRDDDVVSDGCRTEVHAGGDDKAINPAEAMRPVHADVQSKDCSFDLTGASDKFLDVKDDARVRPFNGKNTSSDVSAEGKTRIESKPVSDSKEMDTQLDMQLMDDANKCSSRFLSPATIRRGFSSDAELRDRNKRPATLCKYFAKGWCIKADSCRFVHTSSDSGNTSHKLGGITASGKCDVLCGRGSRDFVESPSSANGSQIASDRHTVGGSSSTLQHNFSQLETGLAGFGLSSSSHSSSRVSKHRSVEEASLMHSQYMFNNHIEPGFGYSINQYHMRDHSSSSSAFRQDQFGAHKVFTSKRQDDALRPTWVQNPFPSSSPSIHRESNISTSYKSNFIPHNWEQSTPFQSSFSAPLLCASNPGRLDDTLPVSIEQPVEKNNSVKPSLGVELLPDDTIRDSIEHAAENNISVKPSLGVGLLSEGTSDSWNAEKRKYNGYGKEIPSGEAESVATSVTDPEKRTRIAKNESSFDASVDIANASRSGVKNSRVRRKDTFSRIELKVDGWKNGNIDVENAECEDMHWNSKSVKHFRAALVEFVKELMKPSWQEGRLTKDAYKFIVQKVEEKVTNSLLPNLIPSTSEHTKQYLSFSRTKLSNLIEAYADKYGKHVSTHALV